MDQFVTRAEERERLQTLYESGAAELAIIYGRRQIGKSELVRQSIIDRDDAVYYQAVQGTATTQLRRFVEAAATTYPEITSVKEEWEPLLTYLTDRDAVIVIAEFPYLIESNEGLPSIIQHLWDTAIDESQATLVLTGSAIGMIHTHVLDGGAPLYGRVSQTPNGRLELTQLPFRSIHEFVPTYDPEERVFVYGVFGGTPRYLSPLDPSQSLGENITRLLCDPDGPLHDEPETVLQMELNEVNTYFSVLESMASGNRSRNEIAQGAGIESTNTSYYFDRLDTLQITRNTIQRSPTRRVASVLDTKFVTPCSDFTFGISTDERVNTNSTARTPTRISSNPNCPTSSARRSNRSVIRRCQHSMPTTSSRRCRVSGGTRVARWMSSHQQTDRR